MLLGGGLLPAMVIGSRVVPTPCDPTVDSFLIKPPYLSDTGSRDFALSGVFQDGEFVELDVLRYFLCGHDLKHGLDLHRQGKENVR